MSARYLIRLDDACPTMDVRKWERFEEILGDLDIKPMVAVVPDNRDPVLQVNDSDPDFWDKIRNWQAKGWSIAMHGYQHVFHPIYRKRLLLPFYDRSEFAGLSYSEQAAKIRESWRLFKEQGVAPTLWVAPAHCFDSITLEALRDETPIRIVSDGIACDQFYQHGFYWLPQQLWSLTGKRSGLWTVCLHPSSMNIAQIDEFNALLSSATFRSRIVAVADVSLTQRKMSLTDWSYSTYFWQRGRLRRALNSVRSILHVRSR